MRDSSLSACMQAVVAAEVGHVELAYDYFGEAALMDLDNLMDNTRDGLHIASLAGSWIAAVAGFGGMRDHGGELSFRPRLPAALTRLAFRVTFRGRCLRVDVRHGEVTLRGAERRSARDRPRRRTHPPGSEGHALVDAPGRRRGAATQPPGRAPLRRRPR